MKNKFKVLGFIALAAIIGISMTALSLTGCGDGGGSDSNPFIGTWVGDDGSTVTITDSTSSYEAPGQEKVSSTYTRNGNTATFQIGSYVGTAIVSGNTMTITVTVNGNEIQITFAKRRNILCLPVKTAERH